MTERLPLSQRRPRLDRWSQYADLALAWGSRALGRGAVAPHRILVTSLPKSGTNLLLKTLDELPDVRRTRLMIGRGSVPAPRSGTGAPVGVDWPTLADPRLLRGLLRGVPPGGVVAGHVPYSTPMDEIVSALDMRVAVIIRDPRDVAASMGPYVTARPRHFLHERFAALTPEEQLLAVIEGMPADRHGHGLLDLRRRIVSITDWARSSQALVLRFEDLVGTRGGGDDSRQVECVERLAHHVGVDLAPGRAHGIASKLYGGTDTFRKGQIGGWEGVFGEQHRAAATRVLGDFDYSRV